VPVAAIPTAKFNHLLSPSRKGAGESRSSRTKPFNLYFSLFIIIIIIIIIIILPRHLIPGMSLRMTFPYVVAGTVT
jgi:hypothetical protein